MHTIFNLLKLQIDNKTDLFKTATPSKMVFEGFKKLFLIALVWLLARVILFRIFSFGIIINAQVIALILLISQGISLAFSIGHVISTLYTCKDNEMLICLPVTPNQLFISKIILIYLKELAVNVMFWLPVFLVIGNLGGFGASYYLSIPIVLLLLPVLPLVIGSFISIPIMQFIKFLKKHVVLTIILLLLLVSVLLWGYISLVGNFVENFDVTNKHLETGMKLNKSLKKIGSKIYVLFQIALAMLSFSKWFYFPIFIAICLAIMAITVTIIRPFYFKIAMSSTENTTKKKYKKKDFKNRSVFTSLIFKEIAHVFRSPSEVFEYFLFTLLMPFIVFSYDKLLMSITVNQAGINMIAGSHLMVVAILAMLSNLVSSSTISRDGSNFYTSKIVPVNYYTQMFAKLTFNAIFTISAIVVTAIISCFIYPAWQIIIGSIAVIFAAVGHIAWSIDMDIKNPTVNMQGNEQASVTGKNTPKSLICGLVIGFIMGMIIIMTSGNKSSPLPYIILVALSVAFAVYRVYTLVLRINLAYDKIEM